ncbi:MAG: hypothetical protein ACPGQS_01430 [Bradymonadia bacterium]
MPTPCLRWIVLTTALFLGCTPAEDTTQTTSGEPQQSNRDNPQARLAQDILVSGIPGSIENTGAQIIIEARDELTGHIAVFKTNAINGVFELNLSTLTLPIHIEAFIDLNQSDRIDRCPTPARSNQIISDEKHDLWLGRTRLSRAQNEPYEIEFSRSFCGPSAGNTAWSGQIVLPEVDFDPAADLLAHIKTIHDEGTATFETVLNISYLATLEAEQRQLSLSKLLPGRHELRIFWDNDADFQFSPCLEENIGGGDQGFSELITFETNPNDNLESEAPIVVNSLDCPEDQTSVSGSIDARALELFDARQTTGPLFLELLNAETNERIHLKKLNPAHSGELSFRLTNLPRTQLIARAFIDRDGDERFSSCSGSTDGQDLFSSINRTLDLAFTPQHDLGVLQLQSHDCPIERLSNVSIAFTMDSAGARKESARPVYVVLAHEASEDMTTVELTDNHMSLTQPQRLQMTLPPGDYSLFAYVDTEMDAQFTHCEFDAFGDRAAANVLEFQLSQYELYTAPVQTITRFGCDFPTVQFNLNVNLPSVPANVSERELVIHLLEAGGLNEMLTFDVPPVAPPWFFPINDLVPGAYTVSVHLDQDGDRRRNHCENDGVRELEGQYVFELNRESPVLDASIDLIDPCIEP